MEILFIVALLLLAILGFLRYRGFMHQTKDSTDSVGLYIRKNMKLEGQFSLILIAIVLIALIINYIR